MTLCVDSLRDVVREAVSDRSATLRFAAIGWLDALLYDGAFIARLDEPPRYTPGTPAPAPTSGDSPDHILGALTDNLDDAATSMEMLRQIAKGSQRALRESDAPSSAGQQTIVVVGAGPIGLLAALTLRKFADESVCIQVVEKRSDRSGYKEPYSRDWLTHLAFELFAPLVPADVMHIIERLGRERCGLPINLIESLLLLAARRAGVRFSLSDGEKLDTTGMAPVALLLDASGGQWREAVASETPSAPQQVSWSAARQHGAAFVQSGYPAAIDHGPLSTQLVVQDDYAYPVNKGRPLQLAMVKITGIPATFQQALRQAVTPHNADHKFYIWRGNMPPELNELLVIVKLSRAELRTLGELYSPTDDTLSVDQVLANARGLSQRLTKLMQRIRTLDSARVMPAVQRPFIYTPRWLAVPQHAYAWRETPVIKLGDSVYNGNPVSGNGLTGHMTQLIVVHNALESAHRTQLAATEQAA